MGIKLWVIEQMLNTFVYLQLKYFKLSITIAGHKQHPIFDQAVTPATLLHSSAHL
jgi:hypothetical protein